MDTVDGTLQTPVGPADRYTVLSSPIGALLITGNKSQVLSVHFPEAPDRPWDLTGLTEDGHSFAGAVAQLDEYFAGERRTFDLPLAPTGQRFQLKVWAALLTIGYGETASYGEIAQAVGLPGAARAVGAANHVNPIPIIIPCHRVIGADGSMTGFGGGLPTKHFLLALEVPTLF